MAHTVRLTVTMEISVKTGRSPDFLIFSNMANKRKLNKQWLISCDAMLSGALFEMSGAKTTGGNVHHVKKISVLTGIKPVILSTLV